MSENSDKDIIRVYDALEKMLNFCDGARKYDGIGFNKYHRNKIDNIMEYDKDATNEKAVMNVLENYKNTQLEDYEIRNEYGRAPELDEYDIVLEIKKNDIDQEDEETDEGNDQKVDQDDRVNDMEKKILIRFDYNEDLVDVMKESSAEYNPDTQNWHIDIKYYDKLKKYFNDTDYEICDLCDL